MEVKSGRVCFVLSPTLTLSWRLLELDASSTELPVTGDPSPDWLRLRPKPSSLLQLMHALFKDVRTELGVNAKFRFQPKQTLLGDHVII